MKLRLLDDSIRLRLSRSEVVAADEKGLVEGRTRFPYGSAFTYALEALPSGSVETAAYEGDRITIGLPTEKIMQWAKDDAVVSLRGKVNLPDGKILKLLVEKDFVCLSHRDDEDQSNLFPNPESTAC
ncbi:MAG: hypothetical protein OEQ25_07625 [Gammaproteobacteria bacterium]|nr:hypothetical protein [Gammaproteobacteria bacterium]MDH3506995.1 hypothetical protein [Gammaproteobacteria bacterium]